MGCDNNAHRRSSKSMTLLTLLDFWSCHHVLLACVKSAVKSVPHIFVTLSLSVVTRFGNVTNKKLCEDFRTLYQGVMPFSASWRNHIQIKRKMNIYIYIYVNA